MIWNNSDPYSTTTANGVTGGIDDVENNHEWSSFLYVGHTRYQYMYQRDHYGFFMNGKGIEVSETNPPSVMDMTIRGDAEENEHFVFLWVCMNGKERGSENNPPYILPNGMPHCWTAGSIGQSDNGYDSPDGSDYCFIGFNMASPRLEEPLYDENNLYKHLLVFFYYYAVTAGYTVNEALDSASSAVGYGDFTDSKLYIRDPNHPLGNDTYWLGGGGQDAGWFDAWMRIYGNGNYQIPGDVYEDPY